MSGQAWPSTSWRDAWLFINPCTASRSPLSTADSSVSLNDCSAIPRVALFLWRVPVWLISSRCMKPQSVTLSISGEREWPRVGVHAFIDSSRLTPRAISKEVVGPLPNTARVVAAGQQASFFIYNIIAGVWTGTRNSLSAAARRAAACWRSTLAPASPSTHCASSTNLRTFWKVARVARPSDRASTSAALL